MHIRFDEHLGILSFILKCGNYAVQNCTWNICNRKRVRHRKMDVYLIITNLYIYTPLHS